MYRSNYNFMSYTNTYSIVTIYVDAHTISDLSLAAPKPCSKESYPVGDRHTGLGYEVAMVEYTSFLP